MANPMMLPASAQPIGSLQAEMMKIGRLVAQLSTAHAHADVVIVMKDGKIVQIRVNQTFLPTTLPGL